MNLKLYPKYKDSGIEWLGEIPEGWEVNRLKYVASINPEALSENTASDYEMKYVDIGNVNEEGLINEPELMIFSDAPSRARRIIQKDDAIVSTVRTYLKAIAYFPNPNSNLIVSTGFAVLRASKKIISKFLYYFVRSDFFVESIMANSVGVSYPAINSSVLASISVLSPTINEQALITTFLDQKTAKIDELIKKNEKLIELLKEKRQAVISHAVTKGLRNSPSPLSPPIKGGEISSPLAGEGKGEGALKMKDSGIEWIGEIPEGWEVKRLKYVAEIVLGKMLQNEDSGNDELKPYMRAQNIQWETVDTKDIKEMWFSEHEIKKYRLQTGDLLVSEGGEVGRTALWNDDLEECYIQNSVHKVTVNKKLARNKYLLYLLETYGRRGYFESIVNRVSIGHLTREKLKEIEIICPPKIEQEQIVIYLTQKTSQIDSLIQKIQSQIATLKEYRQALISNVVTGKMRVE